MDDYYASTYPNILTNYYQRPIWASQEAEDYNVIWLI
jgi:hypothetical protein